MFTYGKANSTKDWGGCQLGLQADFLKKIAKIRPALTAV